MGWWSNLTKRLHPSCRRIGEFSGITLHSHQRKKSFFESGASHSFYFKFQLTHENLLAFPFYGSFVRPRHAFSLSLGGGSFLDFSSDALFCVTIPLLRTQACVLINPTALTSMLMFFFGFPPNNVFFLLLSGETTHYNYKPAE